MTSLIQTLPGSEDHTWAPQGVLLMAQGSRLHKWDPASDPTWRETADLAEMGIGHITRLAVSPDGSRIALVADRKATKE